MGGVNRCGDREGDGCSLALGGIGVIDIGWGGRRLALKAGAPRTGLLQISGWLRSTGVGAGETGPMRQKMGSCGRFNERRYPVSASIHNGTNLSHYMEQHMADKVVVGIDVGENSVGLAAVLVDESGTPTKIHRLMSVLHDGGKDGMASGQTASVSRKASGGAARRVRRLLRNRRRRALKLRAELEERGYPLTEPSALETYEEWDTRLELLHGGYIEDDVERRRKLAIAIQHMSNHRGWANAWVPLDQYLWKEEPTESFTAAVDLIRKDAESPTGRFALEGVSDLNYQADLASALEDVDVLVYQADLASLGLSQDERIRPRRPSRKHSYPNPGDIRPVRLEQGHLLGKQRREDVVREWRQICRVQRVSDTEFADLARIAFAQERPSVPAENVGKDWLPGYRDRFRASIASLEHQEFQIRQTVANLRIRENLQAKDSRRLSVEEQNLIVDTLMAVTDRDKAPTWREIAEDFLNISHLRLIHADQEGSASGKAPIMRSVIAVLELKPKSHPVRQWWEKASPEDRSAFVRWFADPVRGENSSKADEIFIPLFESLDEDQVAKAQVMKFPSGRSAHCVETLRLMNAEMSRTGDSYVEVRNQLFSEDGENLIPERPTLDVVADHPTLQRILPTVRRFLQGVERELGHIDRVTIEHVRNAFLGFAAKREAAARMAKNRRDRENAAEQIRASDIYGGVAPTSEQIRRVQIFERQNGECLYCGAAQKFSGIELDHIVPRRSGGNSTLANLAAVCRDCNSAKDGQPFPKFAESGKRPGVSLDVTLQRVDALNQGQLDKKVFGWLKQEMKRRLKQRESDELIDERALATTAYAATDMRDRIMGTYDLGPGSVPVYSGRIVQLARRASGIDKKIELRPGLDSKSRFDRRHHAIDAVVAAMLNQSIAQTLAQREDLYRAARDGIQDVAWRELNSKGDDWKSYTGVSRKARVSYGEWRNFSGFEVGQRRDFAKWKSDMEVLAQLIKEELAHDQVVVTHPIRVSAHHSALHEDGRAPHARKELGSTWSPEQRALIVDDRVYEALSGRLAPSDALVEDAERTLRLPSGIMLTATDDIFLFPDTAARIALPRQSSAKLGQSAHHARLYRWDDAKGKRQAGIVRVFASDLYDLEGVTFDAQGRISGDILRLPLRESSRAVRRAGDKLRAAFWAGTAEHVGTFVVGDEIEINPEEWAGDDAMGQFLDEFSERHWRLVGLMSNSQLTLNPVILSSEGIVTSDSDEKRKVRVSDNAAKIISDRIKVSYTRLWGTASTRVIRRTATGAVRPSSDHALPASWSPHRAVYGD